MGSVVLATSRTRQPAFGVLAGNDPSIAANGAGPAFLWVPGSVECVGGAVAALSGGGTYAGSNGANVLAAVKNGFSPKYASFTGGNSISALSGGPGLTFLVVLESYGGSSGGAFGNLITVGTVASGLGVNSSGALLLRTATVNTVSTLTVPSGPSVLIGGYVDVSSILLSCNGATYSATDSGHAQAAAKVTGVGGYSGQTSITANIALAAAWNRLLSADEFAALSENPWRLFQRPQRRLYFGAGGSSTVVTPGVGSLTLTGFAPSVTFGGGQSAHPGVGAITLTGYSPTVVQKQVVIPGVGSIVLTGYAPTIVFGGRQTVTPGLGSLLLTGYAPSVSQATPGANATSVQVLEDGPRYTVLKFTFLLGSSDLAQTLVVDPAAQYIDPTGSPTTRYALIAAEWAVPKGITLQLQWKATVNTDALSCNDTDHIQFPVPLRNNAGAGANGQLIAVTKGYVGGTYVGTVVLALLKGN